MPPFNMNKVIHKIRERTKSLVEFEFPLIHVYGGDDLTNLKNKFDAVKGGFKNITNAEIRNGIPDDVHVGWIMHDTYDSFSHTCNVIAKRIGVHPRFVIMALWLIDLHFGDGEDYGGSAGEVGFKWNNRSNIKKAYGVSDDVTSMLISMYGRPTIANVSQLAVQLSEEGW